MKTSFSLMFLLFIIIQELNAQFPSCISEFKNIISNEKTGGKKIKKITTSKFNRSKFDGLNITNFDSTGKMLDVLELSKNGTLLQEYKYRHRENIIIKEYYIKDKLQYSEYYEYKDSLIISYSKKYNSTQDIPLIFSYNNGFLMEIHKGKVLLYSILYENNKIAKVTNSDSTIYAEFIYHNDILTTLHYYGSETKYFYSYIDNQKLASIKCIHQDVIDNTTYCYFTDGSYSVKNSRGKYENWAHYNSSNNIIHRVLIKNNKIIYQMYYKYEFY